MNKWPKSDPASMNAFYGCPDLNGDGRPDPEWERQNITYIEPPYPMVLAWNIERRATKIAIHRKCADSLYRILSRIRIEVSAVDIQRYQLNRYGGAYMFRLMRGGSMLSIHSWGAAIDLSPDINAFGVEYGYRANMMPMNVAGMFGDEGWKWGKSFRKEDSMHFEATHI